MKAGQSIPNKTYCCKNDCIGIIIVSYYIFVFNVNNQILIVRSVLIIHGFNSKTLLRGIKLPDGEHRLHGDQTTFF